MVYHFNIRQGQNHEAIMILKRHFNLLRDKKHKRQKCSQTTSTFILYQTRSKIKTASLIEHLLFFFFFFLP